MGVIALRVEEFIAGDQKGYKWRSGEPKETSSPSPATYNKPCSFFLESHFLNRNCGNPRCTVRRPYSVLQKIAVWQDLDIFALSSQCAVWKIGSWLAWLINLTLNIRSGLANLKSTSLRIPQTGDGTNQHNRELITSHHQRFSRSCSVKDSSRMCRWTESCDSDPSCKPQIVRASWILLSCIWLVTCSVSMPR